MEQQTSSPPQIDPGKIIGVGMGFFASKVLLTAVNMGVFTKLATQPMSGQDIQAALGLHPRGLYDFLDTLSPWAFWREKESKDAQYIAMPPTVIYS